MPIEVITGPPFSGKAEFARAEIARRERAGELGLVLLDYTALYSALVPGVQSSYRDDAVSDTGAPRATGAAYEWMLGTIAARELSGYITTQSPRRALAISNRFEDAPIWDLWTGPDDVAERVHFHMEALGERVPRAAMRPGQGGAFGDRLRALCGQQAQTYYRERPGVVGRAREVRQTGRGSYRKGGPAVNYDERFVRGLTPAGREARAELVSEGNLNPTPADVFKRTLQRLGRRP